MKFVTYAILLIIISEELLGEINYIIVRFPEYDICGKNEKNSRRDKSNTRKSTEGNEKICK